MNNWQNLLSTLLSKLDNIPHLAGNPFFSCQIPPDLQERIEHHIAKTGESKNQVLINALNTYLNQPRQLSPANVSPVINTLVEEKFNVLSARIATVELSLKEVRSGDTKHINREVHVIDINDIENTTPNVLSDSKVARQDKHNLVDNTVAPKEAIGQNDQNGDGIGSEQQSNTVRVEDTPAKFENLTSAEMAKQTGLKQPQIDGYKRKVTTKYQKMGHPLEAKKLLISPEKIETIQPILINGYPYNLFYLGQNEKGNNLWTALPGEGGSHIATS